MISQDKFPYRTYFYANCTSFASRRRLNLRLLRPPTSATRTDSSDARFNSSKDIQLLTDLKLWALNRQAWWTCINEIIRKASRPVKDIMQTPDWITVRENGIHNRKSKDGVTLAGNSRHNDKTAKWWDATAPNSAWLETKPMKLEHT